MFKYEIGTKLKSREGETNSMSAGTIVGHHPNGEHYLVEVTTSGTDFGASNIYKMPKRFADNTDPIYVTDKPTFEVGKTYRGKDGHQATCKVVMIHDLGEPGWHNPSGRYALMEVARLDGHKAVHVFYDSEVEDMEEV